MAIDVENGALRVVEESEPDDVGDSSNAGLVEVVYLANRLHVARDVLKDRISSTAAVSTTTPRRYLNGSASPAPVTVGAARRIDRRTHLAPSRWGLRQLRQVKPICNGH
jgi:hypothetical protein